MAERRDGQHRFPKRHAEGSPPGAIEGADFKKQLLSDASEAIRLLRRIDAGIAALVRQSGDPYAEAFGESSKASAEELAALERGYGILLDRLSDAEAEALAERLLPPQQEAFKRSGKYAVKIPLMRLMAGDRAAKAK